LLLRLDLGKKTSGPIDFSFALLLLPTCFPRKNQGFPLALPSEPSVLDSCPPPGRQELGEHFIDLARLL
jgi:hypothetical protein